MNRYSDTDLRSIQTLPLRHLLRRLARARYGIVSTGMYSTRFVDDFLTDCKWAARTGRVVHIGQMDYAASKKSAQSGLDMIMGGRFGFPFDTTWCVVGDTTYDPDDAPSQIIVFHRPEDNVFAECFVSGEGDLVAWYMARAKSNGETEVIVDNLDQFEVLPDTRRKFSYAAAVNTLFSAVAICNTRGISFERDLSVKKPGKGVAGCYRFKTGQYFTVLGKSRPRVDNGPSGRQSPVAHVRKAHMRRYQDGREVWIHEALVNVRSEHELAFTETKRVAYTTSGRAR